MNSHLWIEYKKGFKYQLAKTCIVKTVLFGYNISTRYIRLTEDGTLVIYYGYAWDGPSGPTIDTKNFMRGALVHDALYQLLREGYLPQAERFIADGILRQICLEDGMSKLRAWYVFHSVDKFAATAASPKNKKTVCTAP